MKKYKRDMKNYMKINRRYKNKIKQRFIMWKMLSTIRKFRKTIWKFYDEKFGIKRPFEKMLTIFYKLINKDVDKEKEITEKIFNALIKSYIYKKIWKDSNTKIADWFT